MEYNSDIVPGWERKLELVDFWLDNLKQNISIANPWIESTIYRKLDEFLLNSNVGFDPKSKDWVNEKLDLILESLKEMSFDIDRIKEDFEYFKSATDRVSQKDWKMMFWGGIFGWVIDKVVPPEKVQDVFASINNAFSSSSNILT